MIYIIGGTSRSGKSILARKLLEKRNIPYFSLDFLMRGLVDGCPELGLDPSQNTILFAKKIQPIVQNMLENIISVEENYCIEGDSILPELVAELRSKYPRDICCCFLGYRELTVTEKSKQIEKYAGFPNDWMNTCSNEEKVRYVKEAIEYGNYLYNECVRHRIPFYDTSALFNEKLEDAAKWMLEITI